MQVEDASPVSLLLLSFIEVLSLADRVRHFHIFDKLIVNKGLVVNSESMYKIILGKLLYLSLSIFSLSQKPPSMKLAPTLLTPENRTLTIKATRPFTGCNFIGPISS